MVYDQENIDFKHVFWEHSKRYKINPIITRYDKVFSFRKYQIQKSWKALFYPDISWRID